MSLAAHTLAHMVPGSLSPSRAADFMQCALLYRFRAIDQIPEPPSSAAVRGTLVHSVLEHLFDAAPEQRTLDAAISDLPSRWAAMTQESPELPALLEQDGITHEQWMTQGAALLETYFRLEDPTSFNPAEREVLIEWTTDEGIKLKGFVDRLDRANNGMTRVVDYKTGKAPREGFEAKAMFQMRFYALVLWRSTGVIPSLLQLLYLSGGGEILRYQPDEADLVATERKVKALWQAITAAYEQQSFRPNPSALCSWCTHKALCPAFGGELPTFPVQRQIEAPVELGSDL